jgi:short-subunit dehydrogenase
MESIKGKSVLLAGATGGIGQALAKLLAGSGAQLFLTGRTASKLKAIAETLNLDQERWMAADLTNEADVTKLFEQFSSVMPSIDVLINASGIGIIKPAEQLSEEEFMRTLQLNLYAPFMLLRKFLPEFKAKKKGLIIHVPGILGKVPMAGAAAYSASKYGLVGMLQSIREELKRTDVRVTNLFLGGVDSPFWDHIELRVQRDKMVTAEEAARAIWFLCQQPASGVVSEMVLQPFNHQAI